MIYSLLKLIMKSQINEMEHSMTLIIARIQKAQGRCSNLKLGFANAQLF